MNSRKKELAVIFCPPCDKFPEKPDDISHAEKKCCPKCNKLMWFSVKKKAMMRVMESLDKEIWFGCHNCFQKEFEKMAKHEGLKHTDYVEIRI